MKESKGHCGKDFWNNVSIFPRFLIIIFLYYVLYFIHFYSCLIKTDMLAERIAKLAVCVGKKTLTGNRRTSQRFDYNSSHSKIKPGETAHHQQLYIILVPF